MERFENIWLSSENHLEVFKEIKKEKNLLSKLDDPNIGKRYFNFPRIIFGSQIMPVIFESITRLVISDSALEFYPKKIDSNSQYLGLKTNENAFISFEQIRHLEIIKQRTSFIPYFDNSWIKISYMENNEEKDVLISYSGKGLVMRRIKAQNIELLKKLEKSINVA